MKNLYLSVGIGVVVLLMIVFALIRNRLPIGKFSATNPTPTPVTTENAENKETILVSKHTPASTAVIDGVNLVKPGFIAIHENQNGAPGAILGVSELLSVGKHENMVIPLSRKTVSGEELFAMAYVDNGDGKFDQSDEVVKESNSNPLMAQFLVSSEISGFQIPATGLGEE